MPPIKKKEDKRSGLIRGSLCAFSTYSILPLPGYEFKSHDLRYSLVAFPFVGLTFGMFSLILACFARSLGLSPLFFAGFNYALLALLSGGIHLDGFADACDGIFSRRSRDEMLRIMHDPNIGPMAVIALIGQALVHLSLDAELFSLGLQATRISFFRLAFSLVLLEGLARTQSAALVIKLPQARREGMSKSMSDQQAPDSFNLLLGQYIVYSFGLLVFLGLKSLVLTGLIPVFTYIFSRYFVKKFSGITGDLAGFFLIILGSFYRLLTLLLIVS